MQGMPTDLQDMHQQHEQGRLLRAENVAKILGIDRSTVYRMAETGQLQAVKIGRQWRFRVEEIEQLLQVGERTGYLTAAVRSAMLPVLRAASPMIEVASQILGIMMAITDMNGAPLTEMFNPCPWFVEHSANPDLMDQCVVDWKYLADDPDFGARLRTGPLNFDRARSFIRVGPELIGMVVAGGIAASDDDERALFRLSEEGRERVLTSLPVIAAKVSRLVAAALKDQGVDAYQAADPIYPASTFPAGRPTVSQDAAGTGDVAGVRGAAAADGPTGSKGITGTHEQRRIL
ncbi:MAG: helix-turn-helix domain-containing protein [Acidimicrobiales bacterium]